MLLLMGLARAGADLAGEQDVPRHDLTRLERVELLQVLDGDTLDVLRGRRRLRVRLLGVDTEERLHPAADSIPGAPQTVFGEETALWLEQLLRHGSGERPRLGLVLPQGAEQRDAHGRLLAHVALPDGRDLDVLLVRKGFSPYFQRYGSSLVAHEAFERAQAAARREGLGIWNPRTNAPSTPGAPRAARDYGALVAWWEARAAAIRSWREASANDAALDVVAADRPEELRRAARAARAMNVFAEVEGARELSGGALLVFLRSAPEAPEVRLLVPASMRRETAPLELAGRGRAGRQGFLWIEGRVREREGRLWIDVESPDAIRLAGPEPAGPTRGGRSAAAGLRGRGPDER